MEQQMGRRKRGQECFPSHPQAHQLVIPLLLARPSLLMGNCSFLSLTGTAKSGQDLGLPPEPGMALCYFPGSCCQPGSSRGQQDCLSPAAADSQQPGPALYLRMGLIAPLQNTCTRACAPFLLPTAHTGWSFPVPSCFKS
jgi:hypothetical protein